MTNPVVIETAPGTGYLDITREFDAPVQAVFRAHADPELFVQWNGPRELTGTVTSWDFRDGGSYAYEHRDAAGETYEFRGVIHTVVENSLIIQTFEYLGAPGEVSLDQLRFEALSDRRCRLVGRVIFPSVAALDRMVAEGMEHGVIEGYQKLDELLRAR
jgi:uncharacterized protein YndB with AHSA1/START domain